MAAGDHAIAHATQLVHRANSACIPGEKAVHRLVVVVEVLVDVQAAEIELQRIAGLELQVDHGAVAFAVLLEPRGVDRVGHVRIGRHAAGCIGEGAGWRIAEHFHAAPVHAFFVVLRGDGDAEGFCRIFPAVQQRRIRLALAGLVAVAIADGGGHLVGLQVERLARVHEHGATQAAFGQACFGRLDDFRTPQDLRCQQGVIETAAGLFAVEPDCLRHRVAVQKGEIEAGVGAVDADALALAKATVQGDAGNLRQRFGHVGAGELADVLGGDRFGNAGVVTLGVQRFFKAGADADHLHGIQFGGLWVGRMLCLGGEHQRHANGAGQQRSAVFHDVSPHHATGMDGGPALAGCTGGTRRSRSGDASGGALTTPRCGVADTSWPRRARRVARVRPT